MSIEQQLQQFKEDMINILRAQRIDTLQLHAVRSGRVTKERAMELLNRGDTWLKEKVKAGIIIRMEDGWYDEASITAYFRSLKPENGCEEIDFMKRRKIKIG